MTPEEKQKAAQHLADQIAKVESGIRDLLGAAHDLAGMAQDYAAACIEADAEQIAKTNFDNVEAVKAAEKCLTPCRSDLGIALSAQLVGDMGDALIRVSNFHVEAAKYSPLPQPRFGSGK